MLQEIKDHLKITWDDENDSLERMILRAKDNFNSLIGVELEYDTNSQVKALFLNYCRYDYNQALEYFEENFSKEILRMQLQEGVKANAI